MRCVAILRNGGARVSAGTACQEQKEMTPEWLLSLQQSSGVISVHAWYLTSLINLAFCRLTAPLFPQIHSFSTSHYCISLQREDLMCWLNSSIKAAWVGSFFKVSYDQVYKSAFYILGLKWRIITFSDFLHLTSFSNNTEFFICTWTSLQSILFLLRLFIFELIVFGISLILSLKVYVYIGITSLCL